LKKAEIKNRFSFIFVSHRGQILTESVLLGISLAEKNRGKHSVTVAIPKVNNCNLTPEKKIIEFFLSLGIEVKFFKNEYLNSLKSIGVNDWYSNKLYALDVPSKGKKVVFLDSDILCLTQPKLEERFITIDFNARMAGKANILPAQWYKLYDLFQLPLPDVFFPCLSDGVLAPPYFNSGVVAISRDKREVLSEKWKEAYYKISKEGILNPQNYIFIDQVALALAVQLAGLTYDLLDIQYNFLSGKKLVNPQKLPIFSHYHSPEKLYRDPFLRLQVQKYMHKYPVLKDLIRKDVRWNKVFGGQMNYWNLKAKRLIRRILHSF